MSTRKDILEQLARGEIDVTQAADRLSQSQSVDEAAPEPVKPRPAPTEPEPSATPEPEPAQPAQPAPKSGRRWLHIHVSDLETGRNRVRVNVPLGLVQFGLKVGQRVTDEIDSDMIQDVMDTLQDNELVGTLVEVEDLEDNEHVHIFVD